MIQAALKEIQKYYGANKVLDNITFEIKSGERVGIIGENGCGKTTVFKILSGSEKYDGGTMAIRKGAKIGYLDQIPIYSEEFRVIDVLNEAFKEVFEIKNEMKQLEYKMGILSEDELEKTMKRYAYLQESFEAEGGYDIEEKLSKICTGLKFGEEFLQKKFSLLSGGEKTTVILGRILLESPDILLLDEPTNHLDVDAIEWLEEFLCAYKGTVLIISHDRYFLDKVATKIIEIEQGNNSLYHGNYSYYILEKERRILEQLEAYNQQQRKIKAMEDAIRRFRDWGTRGDNEKFFKKAASMEKRIDKMDKVDRPLLNRKKIQLSFNESIRSGKEVLDISGLKKSFDNRILINEGEFSLKYLDKTALLGKNGCGKSTLIKIIMDEYINNYYGGSDEVLISYLPDFYDYRKEQGIVKIGSNVKIAYLDQNVSFVNEKHTIIEAFRDMVPVSEGKARALLSKFLFYGEDVFKKVESLSGGERSRLRLCQLMHQDINLLILDEPTNHLDIDSREMLEMALADFEGTVLFISHDRYFINKIANRIVELKEQKFINYNGDYDYYKNERKKEELKKVKDKNNENKNILKNNKSNNIKVQASNEKQQDKIEKARLKKQKSLEEDIADLEVSLDEINKQIESYASDYTKLTEIYSDKEKLQKELDKLIEEWAEIDN
jgi:ATPase subunit of ABC transporter with duplicated ATPase domains